MEAPNCLVSTSIQQTRPRRVTTKLSQHLHEDLGSARTRHSVARCQHSCLSQSILGLHSTSRLGHMGVHVDIQINITITGGAATTDPSLTRPPSGHLVKRTPYQGAL